MTLNYICMYTVSQKQVDHFSHNFFTVKLKGSVEEA